MEQVCEASQNRNSADIFCVPKEILLAIFRLAAGSSSLSMLALGAVCKAWYAVIRSNPPMCAAALQGARLLRELQERQLIVKTDLGSDLMYDCGDEACNGPVHYPILLCCLPCLDRDMCPLSSLCYGAFCVSAVVTGCVVICKARPCCHFKERLYVHAKYMHAGGPLGEESVRVPLTVTNCLRLEYRTRHAFKTWPLDLYITAADRCVLTPNSIVMVE